MTPEQLQAWRWEREIDERNRPLSDEELDAMFPEGYKVITSIGLVIFRMWTSFKCFLKKLIGQVCIGLAQIYYCCSILLAISKYISVPKSNER